MPALNEPLNPRRFGLRVALAVGLTIFAIGTLVFTNTRSTHDVVSEGIALQRAEALLAANDLALKALVQTVLLAEDRAFGVADDASVDLAVAEARATLDELARRAADLDIAVDGAAVLGPAKDAVLQGSRVLSQASQSEVVEAGRSLAEDAKPAFEGLRDRAGTLRNEHEAALLATGGLASQVGNIARFLVAFLLPLAAIVAYRIAARRQLRVAEVQLDARLAAEHEVVRAKDEFIANMSHELRTPLTSIYGFSEVLLEQGFIDPESARDLIGMINAESAELGRMVEDLLVSARVEADALSYSLQSVSLDAEVDSVIGPLVREGRPVVVRVPDIEIWADPLRVRQMLRNLVSNAIRHGGEQISVEALVRDGRVWVAIGDSGPGVPPEMEPRLFTRFVHEGAEALTVGSVGLGLAVVKALADGMNGEVGYRRLDDWSEFWFSLPLDAATEHESGAPEQVVGAELSGTAATVAAATPYQPPHPHEG